MSHRILPVLVCSNNTPAGQTASRTSGSGAAVNRRPQPGLLVGPRSVQPTATRPATNRTGRLYPTSGGLRDAAVADIRPSAPTKQLGRVGEQGAEWSPPIKPPRYPGSETPGSPRTADGCGSQKDNSRFPGHGQRACSARPRGLGYLSAGLVVLLLPVGRCRRLGRQHYGALASVSGCPVKQMRCHPPIGGKGTRVARALSQIQNGEVGDSLPRVQVGAAGEMEAGVIAVDHQEALSDRQHETGPDVLRRCLRALSGHVRAPPMGRTDVPQRHARCGGDCRGRRAGRPLGRGS